MIKRIIDWTVSAVSPAAGARRAHARKVERSYRGGETNRLTAHQNPKNQSASQELRGPFGADALRAWARMLIRDNAYAFSAKNAIVSKVVGTGFNLQSALETSSGEDEPDTNENRDRIWSDWCEVADINGELSFDEIQCLAYGEMVEAGESLLHFVSVPKVHKGIYRPVPLAIELIEADRLAVDYDTYSLDRTNGHRIERGVELDDKGRPVAYWIYPSHPLEPNTLKRTPERIPASRVQHLYRKDRIGQTRGVTWFAPVMESMRALGTYLENELSASAVASCFTTAIKTETPISQGIPSAGDTDIQDSNGSNYQFLEPGLILNLKPGESLESANPGRPNANAGPWISLIVRGIAAGMGISFESVSKDFSQTSYSSSRTSENDNKPRFRRWQNYWKQHCCQTTWDRFCDAAALAGVEEFPTATELLSDRRTAAPVDIMPPVWEWVDITAEQSASEASINAFQSTYADELGGRGKNWRRNFKQRAKEEAEKQRLGLTSPEDAKTNQANATANQANAVAETQLATTDNLETEGTNVKA